MKLKMIIQIIDSFGWGLMDSKDVEVRKSSIEAELGTLSIGILARPEVLKPYCSKKFI